VNKPVKSDLEVLSGAVAPDDLKNVVGGGRFDPVDGGIWDEPASGMHLEPQGAANHVQLSEPGGGHGSFEARYGEGVNGGIVSESGLNSRAEIPIPVFPTFGLGGWDGNIPVKPFEQAGHAVAHEAEHAGHAIKHFFHHW
jgi:hypothetical protein